MNFKIPRPIDEKEIVLINGVSIRIELESPLFDGDDYVSNVFCVSNLKREFLSYEDKDRRESQEITFPVLCDFFDPIIKFVTNDRHIREFEKIFTILNNYDFSFLQDNDDEIKAFLDFERYKANVNDEKYCTDLDAAFKRFANLAVVRNLKNKKLQERVDEFYKSI